jgi:hypothetical protein
MDLLEFKNKEIKKKLGIDDLKFGKIARITQKSSL